ncbi:MAG: phenylalanine--tRNA ligase subunit beta [Eubacteriales bacterium]|nr:phenylalanine--tRNA ligase subunit beta [Eubacteriales bacterium]
MITSITWVKDYTEIPDDMKSFAERMTITGTICENYEYRGGQISNIVTAKVNSIESHPDSDRLWVCKVFDGETEFTIVTGAQNVRQGDIVPLARNNSTLYDGREIKTGVLRGIESQGMLCSAGELGIKAGIAPKAAEEGIYILPADTNLGVDIKEILGLNDYTTEFELTNNRQDCNSVLGIASEAGAAFGKRFVFPSYEFDSPKNDIDKYLKISVENPELCRRYTARMVRIKKIEPSPMWMQVRLMGSGMRPINNVVDVSNFVMLETGQPLHTFDYDKLKDNKIIVRTAQKDEKFTTLDGVERILYENMLMICDGQRSVCVAGVMGGENSDITDDTKTVVIESANFNGTSVRNTSKKLGLRTESSARFEKGISPFLTKYACDRAASLLVEIGAAEYIDGVIDVRGEIAEPAEVSMDMDWYNSFIGIDLTPQKAAGYLDLLGFDTVISGSVITAKTPRFRQDIAIKEDLAEEVTRMFGYDNIPQTRMETSNYISPRNEYYSFKQKIKQLLIGIGGHDILTYSFDSPSRIKAFGFEPADKRSQPEIIVNPLGEDTSAMRTTILTGLLSTLKLNSSKKNEARLMFEIACAFLKNEDKNDLPESIDRLAVGEYDSNFYEIKSVIEYIADVLKITGLDYERAKEPFLHPGRSAYVLLKGKKIGCFGQIHPRLAKSYDVPESVCMAELDIEPLYEAYQGITVHMKPVAKYPAVHRDLALVMDEDTPAGDIGKEILSRGGDKLISCEVFDVYVSDVIGKMKKSVAYNLVFRSEESTLTDETIEEAVKGILTHLKEKFGITIRE